jgi:hypothetical protein
MSGSVYDAFEEIREALGVGPMPGTAPEEPDDVCAACLDAIARLKRDAKRGRRTALYRAALSALIGWERHMGGWEAMAWRNAKRALRGLPALQE